MRSLLTYFGIFTLACIPLSITGCEDNNVEDATEEIQDAGDDVGDNIEDATEDAGDAIEDATD